MTALPCPAARWPTFSRRLDEGLALPAAERARWLAGLPAAEADLHDALQAVLQRSVDEAADFLTAPRLPAALPPSDWQAGRRVGPYELLRPLGRGGMGEVWLARRADGAYAREVALKLPHAHWLAGALRQRFDRERDILATLAHAHIARFYDAGLAADGQPYLALEAVDGQPITDWCRSNALPQEARLALFAQVLQAVMHAHARLIAHRDLKPGNVLVTAEGQVKLLDFGIATLLQGEARDGGLTQRQGALATPQYAAPEQLDGGPVSVATDVYALGLMLFELLTDAPARPPSARVVADAELPPPSQRIADAARRRAVAGDLDAIVGQALRPRPEDRYASVAALADDLARHRRHEPIHARHPTAWHRLSLFVRRHRLPVGLSAMSLLLLLAGTAGVLWQAQEARAQARRAEAVKDFVLGIFRGADPRLPADRANGQTPAKVLLDRAVARIDQRFADDPRLRLELLGQAADIYRELDETAVWRQLQQRQLTLARQHLGPRHAVVIDGELGVAAEAADQGRLADCRAHLQRLDPALQAAGLGEGEARARWLVASSVCRRDQPDQAAARLALLRQATDWYRRAAPGHRGHVTAEMELANEHISQARLADGVRHSMRALALSQQLPERNESELVTLFGNLGTAQLQQGALQAAGEAFGQAADIAARTTGLDARKAWVPRSRQARALHLAGERDAAWPLFEALLPLLPADDRPHPEADAVREDIGERLAAEGRAAQALPLLQQVERHYRQGGNFEFALRRVQRHLGDALARAGRGAEARAMLQAALAAAERHNPTGQQSTVAARERWARLLLEQGDVAEAERQFQRAIGEAADRRWTHVALAQAGLARVDLARGRWQAALDGADRAQATWDQRRGFYDLRMQAYLWRVRAAALHKVGRSDEARALQARALAQAQRTDDASSPTRRRPAALSD